MSTAGTTKGKHISHPVSYDIYRQYPAAPFVRLEK